MIASATVFANGLPGRKVRAPKSRVLANGQGGRPHGKCHREQTAPPAGGVRVKGCGKSAPVPVATSGARQTPPGARPNREATSSRQATDGRAEGWLARASG